MPSNPQASEVRTWARANGYDVPPRGRIRSELIDAFHRANGRAPSKPRPSQVRPGPSAKRQKTRPPQQRPHVVKVTVTKKAVTARCTGTLKSGEACPWESFTTTAPTADNERHVRANALWHEEHAHG